MTAHPDTIIEHPTSEVHYILPCTWKCSCDWNKTYTGWTAEIKGKIYHIEGERRDGKELSPLIKETIRNPNKK